jgi:hypothetical protein
VWQAGAYWALQEQQYSQLAAFSGALPLLCRTALRSRQAASGLGRCCWATLTICSPLRCSVSKRYLHQWSSELCTATSL